MQLQQVAVMRAITKQVVSVAADNLRALVTDKVNEAASKGLDTVTFSAPRSANSSTVKTILAEVKELGYSVSCITDRDADKTITIRWESL
ncbi:hypothetical protein [Yersinia phage vB_YenM_P778]